jgi:glycosyltransferase involved in cell wall biosynthesis
VREARKLTGMGLAVPPRDPRALAGALLEVLNNREAYIRPRGPIAELFAPSVTATQYEELFEALLKN